MNAITPIEAPDVNEWFDRLLDRYTRVAVAETVAVRQVIHGDEVATTWVTLEVASGVSWRGLFALMEANNLDTSAVRLSLSGVAPRQRGRVAMSCYNLLRGAARRRGGLYGLTVTAAASTNTLRDARRGEWFAAPADWLNQPRQTDYSTPREDREGRPVALVAEGGR